MASRLVLIGGTSHVGKSTLAHKLGRRLGGAVLSTDHLGRHPGRPWGPAAARPHVVDYYTRLTTQEQLVDVLRHYRDVIWPAVLSAAGSASGLLILEGSALLPELVETLEPGREAFWMVEPDDVLSARIRDGSGYEDQDARGRALVDSFVARTLAYQTWLQRSLAERGLRPGVPPALKVP